MHDLTSSVLKKRNLYIRVHEDVFYSYLFNALGLWSRVRIWNFFPRDRALTTGQANLIRDAWNGVFASIPQEIWNGTKWRGYGIAREYQVSNEEHQEQLNAWLVKHQKRSNFQFSFSLRNYLIYVLGPKKGTKLCKFLDYWSISRFKQRVPTVSRKVQD
jgi:hypothetical protein